MDALTSTITAAKRLILSVGSGDGSQQAAIVRSGHHNIISTFYDSEQTVTTKYTKSQEHINLLRNKSTVLFGVDATDIHAHPELKEKKFNIIIFTFPHTGVSNFALGQSGPNPRSIESNKQLIRDFLRSAQQILAQDGEISITLKTSAPYNKWTFPDFVEYEIEPKSQHRFNAQLFQGYIHRSTNGHVERVDNGMARTYVFSEKRKAIDDDDEEEDSQYENFCVSTPFKLLLQFHTLYDDDIESCVMNVLHSLLPQNTNSNVLDIRRQFPEAIRPDTRQLNRVLYQMEASNMIKKGPPKSCNQKPTWTLA